jgi:hypothetical protein
VGAAAFRAVFFFRGAAFFVAFRLVGFRAFADFPFFADLRAAFFFLAAITYFFFLVFFFVVFFAVFLLFFFAICASLGGKPSTGLLLFRMLWHVMMLCQQKYAQLCLIYMIAKRNCRELSTLA